MLFKKFPRGTKKVAGECGCQPLVRLASVLPPLKPSQQRKSVLLGRKRAAAAAVARAELFEDFVPVAGLGVQPHGIGETGTAAALHAYAQAADIGRHAVLFEQRAYFPRGAFGQVDFRDVWACDFSCHFKCSKDLAVSILPGRASANLANYSLSATLFRAQGLRRRAFSSSRRWRP